MVNTGSEVIGLVEGMALKKYKTPLPKLIILGILAGAYIAMGGFLSMFVGYGSTEIVANNPGLAKFLSGAFFPIGLMLIILVGGELFTGNNAYLVVGARRRVIPWSYVPYNWTIIYFTNLIGALGFSYFFIHLTGMMEAEPWHSAIISIGEGKVSQAWHVIFLKGIVANWLVCLAVWLGLTSRDMIGRLVGLWVPVMAFVTLGYEHSIANMFYIPMAMMSGAEFTTWEAIWNNFIPSTLGNIVGGGIFVGAAYSYLYGKKKEES